MIYWWLFWDAVSGNYWRFRRFTLFNVLGCLPHRWCHRVVQTLQGANSQFLVLGTVSLETYPCLSHPIFQHPTSGLCDVSYIQKDVAKKTGAMAFTGEGTTWSRMDLSFPQASNKQWAMSGLTRRGSQILLIPRHRQFPFMSSTKIGRRSKTVVKNAHFPTFQPFHRIDLSFSDAESDKVKGLRVVCGPRSGNPHRGPPARAIWSNVCGWTRTAFKSCSTNESTKQYVAPFALRPVKLCLIFSHCIHQNAGLRPLCWAAAKGRLASASRACGLSCLLPKHSKDLNDMES